MVPSDIAALTKGNVPSKAEIDTANSTATNAENNATLISLPNAHHTT